MEQTLEVSEGGTPNVYIFGDNTVEVISPSGSDHVTLRVNASIEEYDEREFEGGLSARLKVARGIGDTELIRLSKSAPEAKVLLREGFHAVRLKRCIEPSEATRNAWAFELGFEKLPVSTVTDRAALAAKTRLEIEQLIAKNEFARAVRMADAFLAAHFKGELEQAVAIASAGIIIAKGHSQIQLSQYDEAISTFEELIAQVGTFDLEWAEASTIEAMGRKAEALAAAGRRTDALATLLQADSAYSRNSKPSVVMRLNVVRAMIADLRQR